MKKISSKIRGQSTVEFLVAFIFSLSVFWAFVSMSLNFVSGYLVHYATFMAGRAYLVADNGSGTAGFAYNFPQEYAIRTFNSYNVSRFFIKNSKLVFNELDGTRPFGGQGAGARKAKLFIGPYTSFQQNFFVSFFNKSRTLNLVSEAFLGREPTRYECKKRICELITLKTGYDACNAGVSHATLFDDGC